MYLTLDFNVYFLATNEVDDTRLLIYKCLFKVFLVCFVIFFLNSNLTFLEYFFDVVVS